MELNRFVTQSANAFSYGRSIGLCWRASDWRSAGWKRHSAQRGTAIDASCVHDGTVLEVKSTYLRRSQQETWQHQTTTLRKAGQQVQRKVAAVQLALASEPELALKLGLESGGPAAPICGWIVDTSIECDHQRFGGFLKISLEELLIALRDDRHLLHDPDGMFAATTPKANTEPQTLYPQGFSVGRLIDVLQTQALWLGI